MSADIPGYVRDWLATFTTLSELDELAKVVMTWAAEGDPAGNVPTPAVIARMARLIEGRRVELGDRS